jgi:exopolysaccharide biosynthesis polyprenyl glycosylphosphotransferase
MRRNIVKLTLFAGDIILLYLSLGIVLFLRYGGPYLEQEYLAHLLPFTILYAFWGINFYVMDLYNISAPFNHKHYLYAMMVNVGVAVLFFYAFPGLEISPKTNLALIALVFTILFYSWHFLVNKILDTLGIRRPVVIVGSDPHARELAEKIHRNDRLGYKVAGVVRDDEEPLPAWMWNDGVTVMNDMEELKVLAREERVHTIVVSDQRFQSVYGELYDLIPLRINFFQLTSFWEAFDETIPIYATRETWFLENFNRGPNKAYHFIKRILDLIVAVLVLPIILTLSLLTAILVKLTSKGPAIYRQVRVGRNEKEFTIYKFRSMVVDAERNGAQWAGENDPRITPFGRFMRKTRLDELPQIINVLKGQMSFIGPRPERPEFVQELSRSIPHYHLRHLVKPGLTGWAQVKYRYGSSEEDAATKLMYDLYYVKNVSFVLDFKIALKTILIILSKGGR